MKITADDFDLKNTLDSGQFFGFNPLSGSMFEMNVGEYAFRIRQTKNVLYLQGVEGEEVRKKLGEFFDLSRDLSGLYALLNADQKLKPLLRLRGLRILKQDPWEAIASFIISSNNNIKRIQHLWKQLADSIGKKKGVFPSCDEVSRSSPNFLRKLGLGYRAEYLHETARQIAENPSLLESAGKLSYPEAREIFMKFPGIGPKVADCILLFGYQFFESFPVDVWIEKIMRDLYFRDSDIPSGQLGDEARKKWGKWAGYVQQYLFHGSRKGILTIKKD